MIEEHWTTVGLIGHTGYIGPRHIEAWNSLRITPECCNSKDDWVRFIREGHFDIVDIATPIWLHTAMIKEAVRSGADVICEKPLAPTLREAQQIVELSKRTRRKIGIIYQCRFNPKYQKLKRDVEAGKYGEIQMIVYEYFRDKNDTHFAKRPWRKSMTEAGGFGALNIVIHHIDQIQHLMGYPKEVYGVSKTSKIGYDVEDYVIGMFKFPTGAIGTLICSTRANPPKHSKMTVYGTKGYKTIEMRENEYHAENFHAFIAGKGYVTPIEALKSLRLCLTIAS